jgi:hypothetical protein
MPGPIEEPNAPSVTKPLLDSDVAGHPALRHDEVRQTGILIVNADDWGMEREITDRTLECILYGTVSSVSAMVFMADSERAAAIAREREIDAGLHLNFTTPFSAPHCPTKLIAHQQRISRYLRRHRYSQVLFHPGLVRSFEYVVSAQCEEFQRLYGARPERLDGEHHMHLCSNVLLGGLLPRGTIVRRSFSFMPGDKNWGNRFYRQVVDRLLARHHRLTDYFFSLGSRGRVYPPDELHKMFSLAHRFVVEVGVHPINQEEYCFLMEREIFRWAEGCKMAPRYTVRSNGNTYPSVGLALDIPRVPSFRRSAAVYAPNHICVCICTYKRSEHLRRLLGELARQDTGGVLTYSIVVADNDHARSAEGVVSEFTATSAVPIKYCVEPQQNISRARNKAIQNAGGDFLAFIDDDEFPARTWLLSLFKTCNAYGADGVLGPVQRLFDEKPPEWIVKGRFYQRPTHPTGLVMRWNETRTSNVLLKKGILAALAQPFDPDFRTGEDQDFFRRMIDRGFKFVWCGEAVVYEVIPPVRWRGSFMLRRALLRGTVARLHPTFGVLQIAKSLIAVPVYVAALPFALAIGFHRFMTLLVKICDHLGKLLSCLGIELVKDPYVTE